MTLRSPGLAFRQALSKEKPLQIAGAINANHALLAQRAGFQAIYLPAAAWRPVRWGCRTWAFQRWTMC